MTYSFSAPRMELEDFSREQNELTPEERMLIHRDVYGEIDLETVEILLAALDQLRTAFIEDELNDDGAMHRRAVQACPEYATSDDFLLMFLRSTRFDVKAAMAKIKVHWNEKYKLFGNERTFQKLHFSDFTHEELRIALGQGAIQVMPGTDGSGRGLIYYDGIDRTRWALQEHRIFMYRVHWYLIHSLAENNPSVQKNGIVVLGYTPSKFQVPHFDRKTLSTILQQLNHQLPVRIVGIQHVIMSSVLALVMPFVYYLLGPSLRARYRPYTRTAPKELAGIFLKEFGISPEQLPFEFGGTYQFDFDFWMEMNTTQQTGG